MKPMKYIWLIVMFITACTAVKVIQDQAPIIVTPEKDVTVGSTCTTYTWGNRGTPAIGYFKGLVASYRRSLCKDTVAKAAISSKTDRNGYYTDVLKHYGKSSGDELLKTFTMLAGLGLRESSGNFSLGRDYSASGPQSSSSAETGAWQFSYDAFNSSPELKDIYTYYKAHQNECMYEVYFEGMCDPKKGDCKALKYPKSRTINYDGYIEGGAGYDFQKFFRSCPAAQAEYAAVMIRVNARHFGPLNRKEAEYYLPCEKMFKDAEADVACK